MEQSFGRVEESFCPVEQSFLQDSFIWEGKNSIVLNEIGIALRIEEPIWRKNRLNDARILGKFKRNSVKLQEFSLMILLASSCKVFQDFSSVWMVSSQLTRESENYFVNSRKIILKFGEINKIFVFQAQEHPI